MISSATIKRARDLFVYDGRVDGNDRDGWIAEHDDGGGGGGDADGDADDDAAADVYASARGVRGGDARVADVDARESVFGGDAGVGDECVWATRGRVA